MKKAILFVILFAFIAGCTTANVPVPAPNLGPQEVILKIEGVDDVAISSDAIQRVMNVESNKLQLSQKTKIHDDTAYMTFAVDAYGLDIFWKDLQALKLMGIKKIKAFMCSGGGYSIIGMAMTDLIDALSDDDIFVTVEAAGIIGSAAVSVYLAADHRIAHSGTLFLIHPATLFKYFAQEQLEDLRSQERMLTLGKELYLKFLVDHSTMTMEQAEKLVQRDSWFTVEQAVEWGMVEEIK